MAPPEREKLIRGGETTLCYMGNSFDLINDRKRSARTRTKTMTVANNNTIIIIKIMATILKWVDEIHPKHCCHDFRDINYPP